MASFMISHVISSTSYVQRKNAGKKSADAFLLNNNIKIRMNLPVPLKSNTTTTYTIYWSSDIVSHFIECSLCIFNFCKSRDDSSYLKWTEQRKRSCEIIRTNKKPVKQFCSTVFPFDIGTKLLLTLFCIFFGRFKS